MVGFAKTAPAAVRRDVVLDAAHRGDLSTVADLEVVVDANLGAQRDIVADRQAASASPIWAASRQCRPMVTLWPIWTWLSILVPSPITVSRRLPRSIVVPAPTSTSFWIRTPAGLGHLQMALGAEEDEAIAVLADAAAGMDQHVVADQGELDRRARADIAVPADLDVGADHRAGADHACRLPISTSRADHRQRIDDDAVLQMGGRDR